MEAVPIDILGEICKLLQEDDIASLAKCSQHLSSVSKSDLIWAPQCKKKFRIPDTNNSSSLERYKDHHLIPVYRLRKKYFSTCFQQVGHLRRKDLYNSRLSSLRIFFNTILIITTREKKYVGTVIIGRNESYNCFKDFLIFLETTPLSACLISNEHCDKMESLLEDVKDFATTNFEYARCSYDYDIDFNKYFTVPNYLPFIKYITKYMSNSQTSKYTNLPLLTTFNLIIPHFCPIKDYITKLVKSGSCLLLCTQVVNTTEATKYWFIITLTPFDTVKFKFKKLI